MSAKRPRQVSFAEKPTFNPPTPQTTPTSADGAPLIAGFSLSGDAPPPGACPGMEQWSAWRALWQDAAAVVVCVGLRQLLAGTVPPAVFRRVWCVVFGFRVSGAALASALGRRRELGSGRWSDAALGDAAGRIIGCGFYFRTLMIADLAMQRAELRPNPMGALHHVVYYGICWGAHLLMAAPSQWRSAVRSGSWQVLACELLGVVGSAVLLAGGSKAKSVSDLPLHLHLCLLCACSFPFLRSRAYLDDTNVECRKH